MRMTKPISHHLTTGTFNYVVKDPNCIRLSGQLWIKDEIGISQICVLELDALLSSVLAAYLVPSPYFCRLYFGPSRITSAASDVLANFSRLSTSTLLVKLFLAPVEFFPKRKLKTDKDSHNAEISKYRNARRRARSLGS